MGIPGKPGSQRRHPFGSTVTVLGRDLHTKEPSAESRQPDIYSGSQSQRLYFESTNQVRIQQTLAEQSWEREGASGSWQHSPLHSKGPTAVVPSTPSAPTTLGFQGRGPLFSWGLDPKLLLHCVCTEGPFQHLKLHGQGLSGPCVHPRLSRAELSCWRVTGGAAPLPTDRADGGHRPAP